LPDPAGGGQFGLRRRYCRRITKSKNEEIRKSSEQIRAKQNEVNFKISKLQNADEDYYLT